MKHLGSIGSVSDFLKQTEGVHYMTREEIRFFCRGQASMTLKLRPKIGRYKYTGPRIKDDRGEPRWQRNMNLMLSQFEREYIAHHPVELSRRIDRLTLAQHYGLATQLLDWTLNPLVALYFACESVSQTDGIVFFVSSFHLEPDLIKDTNLENACPVQALRPRRFDQRMVNQDSVFTFHRDPILDFADELEEHCSGVIVPGRAKPIILNQLASIGVHKVFIFPGLASICDRIDEGYRGRDGYEEDKAFWTKGQKGENSAWQFDEDLADERTPYLSA